MYSKQEIMRTGPIKAVPKKSAAGETNLNKHGPIKARVCTDKIDKGHHKVMLSIDFPDSIQTDYGTAAYVSANPAEDGGDILTYRLKIDKKDSGQDAEFIIEFHTDVGGSIYEPAFFNLNVFTASDKNQIAEMNIAGPIEEVSGAINEVIENYAKGQNTWHIVKNRGKTMKTKAIKAQVCKDITENTVCTFNGNAVYPLTWDNVYDTVAKWVRGNTGGVTEYLKNNSYDPQTGEALTNYQDPGYQYKDQIETRIIGGIANQVWYDCSSCVPEDRYDEFGFTVYVNCDDGMEKSNGGKIMENKARIIRSKARSGSVAPRGMQKDRRVQMSKHRAKVEEYVTYPDSIQTKYGKMRFDTAEAEGGETDTETLYYTLKVEGMGLDEEQSNFVIGFRAMTDYTDLLCQDVEVMNDTEDESLDQEPGIMSMRDLPGYVEGVIEAYIQENGNIEKSKAVRKKNMKTRNNVGGMAKRRMAKYQAKEINYVDYDDEYQTKYGPMVFSGSIDDDPDQSEVLTYTLTVEGHGLSEDRNTFNIDFRAGADDGWPMFQDLDVMNTYDGDPDESPGWLKEDEMIRQVEAAVEGYLEEHADDLEKSFYAKVKKTGIIIPKHAGTYAIVKHAGDYALVRNEQGHGQDILLNKAKPVAEVSGLNDVRCRPLRAALAKSRTTKGKVRKERIMGFNQTEIVNALMDVSDAMMALDTKVYEAFTSQMDTTEAREYIGKLRGMMSDVADEAAKAADRVNESVSMDKSIRPARKCNGRAKPAVKARTAKAYGPGPTANNTAVKPVPPANDNTLPAPAAVPTGVKPLGGNPEVKAAIAKPKPAVKPHAEPDADDMPGATEADNDHDADDMPRAEDQDFDGLMEKVKAAKDGWREVTVGEGKTEPVGNAAPPKEV